MQCVSKARQKKCLLKKHSDLLKLGWYQMNHENSVITKDFALTVSVHNPDTTHYGNLRGYITPID